MSNDSPKKIAVIGLGAMGEPTLIQLRLEYPNAEIVGCARDSDALEGVKTEIDQALHAAAIKLHKGKNGNIGTGSWRQTSDVADALDGADIAVITGGAKRVAGEQRDALIGRSIKFMDWIVDGVNKLKKEKPKILDRTIWLNGANPLDLTSQYLAEKGGISSDRIAAPLGGELDRLRLEQSIRINLQKYYHDTGELRPEQEIKYGQIRGVEIIGEHGPNNMTLVLSNAEVDIKGDGNFKKLYDLRTKNGERIVDQIVEVPAVYKIKDGKREVAIHSAKRSMLEEFEVATKTGGTKFTEWLGTSNPVASIPIIVTTVNKIVNAQNGISGDSPYFNGSSPVGGEDGKVKCFLSQKLQINSDGSFTPVNRKIAGCELDGKEKKKWDEAVVTQTKKWNELPEVLQKAEQKVNALGRIATSSVPVNSR